LLKHVIGKHQLVWFCVLVVSRVIAAGLIGFLLQAYLAKRRREASFD